MANNLEQIESSVSSLTERLSLIFQNKLFKQWEREF